MMDLKNLKNMQYDEVTTLDLRCHNLILIPEEVYEMENLEDVMIAEGNSIQVSDRYKLLDSLPSIERIDCQDVSQIRSGITNLNSIFVRRLQEMFLTKAASEIYFEEISEEARIEKMVQLAKMTIDAGPEVLKDFKDYKIEKLIRENYEVYVSEALEVTVKLKDEKENKGPPTKKKKGTPSSKSKTKHKHQSLPNISKLSVDIGTNLKLEYLLRTHSKNNDRNDCHTQVWMCAFEPDPQDPSKTTSIVATCGGDSICFIDCETGTVIKKYKQTNEVFYCICWTVFDYKDVITGEERSRSMLAAAGVYGNIRIIDPMELVCYDSISYNKKPVDSLLFHPLKYHWLFSGSEDKTITMWDFCRPFSDASSTAKKAVTYKCNTSGTIRQIAIFPHGKIVLGACDDGVYVWDIESTTNSSSVKNPSYKLQLKGKKSYPLDSALCLTNNLLAVKRSNEGNIQLFHSASEFLKEDANVIYSLQWRVTETPFLKLNFTRGANVLIAADDEGYVWLYDLNDLVQVSKKSKVIKLNHDVFPKKLRCENSHGKVIYHASSSSKFDYLVGVSNANLVAIWTSRDLMMS